ncbi:hypothetical protein Pst134EA_029399 [Puccinia striiformis f. sp. tritici]|uniref:hypothetical protein n=1 Tax=Puccinia striiformis f. sp. tritici TaxID=168172 RepID=UPI0020086FF2|nr:hypothetical protein Pst134EA_029399 [Puccinia striiformis f. sp. tritici]KAH9447360.1 hypothetical protein Pst134EA_029399 [Puccinia striiformis f. sp. tritici]
MKLIHAWATHDVLGESYARENGLMAHATATERTISGFDGSKSQSSSDILLLIGNDPTPSNFIITKLKDTYNGILGMPWINAEKDTIHCNMAIRLTGDRNASYQRTETLQLPAQFRHHYRQTPRETG